MSKFADFHNISARLDTLIRNNTNKGMRVPISNKHLIFMSISRIGLFKTGGIEVDLVSISKFGALFICSHHALHKAKDKNLMMELVLNDKRFQYQAHIVSQDDINNKTYLLFGIIPRNENKLKSFLDDILIAITM